MTEPVAPHLIERQNFGWLPDIPDHRDLLFKVSKPEVYAALPARVDLTASNAFPAVYDQGDLGSCVAQAVAAAIEYEMRKRPNDPSIADFLERNLTFTPSRLFIYYGARELLGTIHEDSGSMIRDAMKVVYNLGAPRESGWPYAERRFAQKPPSSQYKWAPYHKITSYRSVPVDVNAIRSALAQGFPVVFGVAIFNSFYSSRRGDIPMPGPREAMLGGHAMLMVGYDDATQRFKFRNSWGTSWGNKGYGTIPYGYAGSRQFGGDYWLLTDELYKERMT